MICLQKQIIAKNWFCRPGLNIIIHELSKETTQSEMSTGKHLSIADWKIVDSSVDLLEEHREWIKTHERLTKDALRTLAKEQGVELPNSARNKVDILVAIARHIVNSDDDFDEPVKYTPPTPAQPRAKAAVVVKRENRENDAPRFIGSYDTQNSRGAAAHKNVSMGTGTATLQLTDIRILSEVEKLLKQIETLGISTELLIVRPMVWWEAPLAVYIDCFTVYLVFFFIKKRVSIQDVKTYCRE